MSTSPGVTFADASQLVAGRTVERVHILFMDIVGYSLLPKDIQSRRVSELTQIVESTPQYERARAEGQLVALWRGDGMALVFLDDLLSPVRCAMEIDHALKRHAHLPLRMGVHTGGPVDFHKDINDQWDLSGEAVSVAHRVMEPGEARHILLSAEVGEYVSQHCRDVPIPRDLGDCTIKHGGIIRLYNLAGAGIGNAAIPRKVIQDHLRDGVIVVGAPIEDSPAVADAKRSALYVVIALAALIGLYQVPRVRRLVEETLILIEWRRSRPSPVAAAPPAAAPGGAAAFAPAGSDNEIVAKLRQGKSIPSRVKGSKRPEIRIDRDHSGTVPENMGEPPDPPEEPDNGGGPPEGSDDGEPKQGGGDSGSSPEAGPEGSPGSSDTPPGQ